MVVWLALMGWFIRYEAFPGWFTGALAGYRDLLSEGEVYSDAWMLIKFKDRNIGYSHMQVEMDEKRPAERYRIVNRTMLTLNLGGEPQLVNVSSESRLDPFQRLVSFNFTLSARRYAMEIRGERRDADNFTVIVRSGAGMFTTRIRVPDDVVIYSPMTLMSVGRLKPGESARLRTFDPMSIGKGVVAVDDVLVTALGKKDYAWGTNRVEATEISVNYHNMEMTALIDARGQILREDTPFGWSMVLSTPEEALSVDMKGGAGDLVADMNVPQQGVLTDPDTCRELRVRLVGLPFAIDGVASARQQVAAGSNATAIVTLRAGAAEAAAPAGGKERADALAASPYIQAEAPALVAKAREITRGLATDREKALAIAHWVNKSVKKSLTVSLPSALDVLEQREGDCNEHTYLYVGLARAAGLPAQVRVGIVFKDGAWYYHAWPAVHVGHWLELDPTLGLDELGVRHITLLEGELASQAQLMSVMGRLRVEILEQKY